MKIEFDPLEPIRREMEAFRSMLSANLRSLFESIQKSHAEAYKAIRPGLDFQKILQANLQPTFDLLEQFNKEVSQSIRINQLQVTRHLKLHVPFDVLSQLNHLVATTAEIIPTGDFDEMTSNIPARAPDIHEIKNSSITIEQLLAIICFVLTIYLSITGSQQAERHHIDRMDQAERHHKELMNKQWPQPTQEESERLKKFEEALNFCICSVNSLIQDADSPKK